MGVLNVIMGKFCTIVDLNKSDTLVENMNQIHNGGHQ